MSNQVGDRYECSDPNCGCRVEIERPCGIHSADRRGASAESVIDDATTNSSSSFQGASRADRTDTVISTPGDFGAQGASGERTFGSSASGRSAVGSGRYDNYTSRGASAESDARTSSRGNAGVTDELRCFCGSPMKLSSAANRNSQAARMG